MELSPPVRNRVSFMQPRKFWPLDTDPEGALYENPAWDLPGFRRVGPAPVTFNPIAHRTVRRPAPRQAFQ